MGIRCGYGTKPENDPVGWNHYMDELITTYSDYDNNKLPTKYVAED